MAKPCNSPGVECTVAKKRLLQLGFGSHMEWGLLGWTRFVLGIKILIEKEKWNSRIRSIFTIFLNLPVCTFSFERKKIIKTNILKEFL